MKISMRELILGAACFMLALALVFSRLQIHHQADRINSMQSTLDTIERQRSNDANLKKYEFTAERPPRPSWRQP